MNTLASWGEQLARTLLHEPLPRRWAHVQGVAARARGLAPVLGTDADLIEAAAWLHDIGYAPSLATTGLHQLDGARYLRDAQHADAMLCRLVAHHSCAIIEAGERGLADVLSSDFDPAPGRTGQCADLLRHDYQPGRPARAGRQAARRDT
jgi:HD superfamily phosphodiesterase